MSDTLSKKMTHILGVPAYARDGPEVGQVANLKRAEAGDVVEIYIHVSSHVGRGERMVAIPSEKVITLEGAVVVELRADEIARLPSVGPLQ